MCLLLLEGSTIQVLDPFFKCLISTDTSPELTWPASFWQFSVSNHSPKILFPKTAPISSKPQSSFQILNHYLQNLIELVSPSKKGKKSPLLHSIAFSPSGSHVVTIDLSGNVTISDTSKYNRVEYFSAATIKKVLTEAESGRGEGKQRDEKASEPIKDLTDDLHPIRTVTWWDENSLLFALKNGSVVILGVLGPYHGSPKNRLGECFEKFQRGTIASEVVDDHFFLLEGKDQVLQIPEEVVKDDIGTRVKTAAR